MIHIFLQGALVAFATAMVVNADKLGAHDAIVVEFSESSSLLLDSEKDKITEWVKAMNALSPIDKVLVAAWPDQEAPKNGEKLSAQDRQLAEDRLKTLEQYIQTLGIKKISTYNMARSANWFQRVLDAPQARVRRILSPIGVPPPDVAEEYYRLHSKAKKAVLLLYLK